jgi:hypothetical protein
MMAAIDPHAQEHRMACLTNYTIQCRDAVSGQVGCFLFDTEHWQRTGEFRAVSPVFPGLVEFYAWNNANGRPGGPAYIERTTA